MMSLGTEERDLAKVVICRFVELLAVHDSTDYRPGAEARKQGSNGQQSNLLCGSKCGVKFSFIWKQVEEYVTMSNEVRNISLLRSMMKKIFFFKHRIKLRTV